MADVILPTRPEFALILEDFAERVLRLPGISRANPHAFVEAKSELRGEMMRLAKTYRGAPPITEATIPRVATIAVGSRTIGRARREVTVVSRQRRP